MMPEYAGAGMRSGASTPREPPSVSFLEKHFLEEAKKGASNGSRFDLRSPGRIRPPAQQDLTDSMGLHLLVSTAILDSSAYEILSYDELEALKSELTFVTNRMDAAKRKLMLESKVRDAAFSLNRLRRTKPPSRDGGGGRVTSIGSASSLGPSSPGSPSRGRRIEEVVGGGDEEELGASQRKCEALAAELWSLSLRSWDIQKRLMQHDAGVLGMTHNGSANQTPALMGGILSSPGTQGGRNGMMSPVSEDGFDERSSYRQEAWDGGSPGRRGKGSRPGTATAGDKEVERMVGEVGGRLRRYLEGVTKELGVPQPAFLQNGEGRGVKEKLAEIEDGLRFLEDHPAPKSGGAGGEQIERLERTDFILQNLWNMLRAGEDEVRQKRRREVAEQTETDYELSDYDSGEEEEEELGFSEEVFAAKVEILHNRALKLREAKKTLEKKITNQRKEFEEKLSKITEESDERIDELKVDLKDYEYQIEQLTAQKDQKAGASQEDGEKLKKLVAEIAALKIAKDEAEEDASELNKLLDQEQQISAALKMSVDDANEQMEELREDLGAAHDKSDGIAAERDAYAAQVEQLQQDLKEAEARINALNDEILNMEEKQAAITEQLYTAETTAQSKADESKRLKDELEALEQQLSMLQEQLRIQAETAVPMDRYEAEKKAHEAAIKNYEIEFGVKDEKIAELFILNENAAAESAAAKQELDMIVVETETRLKTLEDEIKWLKDSKKTTEAARDQTEESANALKQELEGKYVEVAELESEVARISMELAMVKADLDEAKGSKQQRAAETAALAAAQKEDPAMLEKIQTLESTNASLLSDLTALQSTYTALQTQHAQTQNTLSQQITTLQQQLADLESKQDRTPPLPTPPIESLELEARNQTLQSELATLLLDFEALTKASLEYESDRRALESQIDALRLSLSETELALADERVRLLGTSSSGSVSGPVESRSTTVLKTEFKKMMRDMRAEQARALRAEQEERRRLEAQIRQLKKDILGSRRTTTASMASALRERLDRDVPPTPTISHHGGL